MNIQRSPTESKIRGPECVKARNWKPSSRQHRRYKSVRMCRRSQPGTVTTSRLTYIGKSHLHQYHFLGKLQSLFLLWHIVHSLFSLNNHMFSSTAWTELRYELSWTAFTRSELRVPIWGQTQVLPSCDIMMIGSTLDETLTAAGLQSKPMSSTMQRSAGQILPLHRSSSDRSTPSHTYNYNSDFHLPKRRTANCTFCVSFSRDNVKRPAENQAWGFGQGCEQEPCLSRES